MKLARRSFYISLALTTAAFVAAFSLYGIPVLALIPLFIALLWVVAEIRRWHWAAAPAFVSFAILIIPAAWLQAHWFFLLVGMLSAVVAWDLSRWIYLAGRAQHLEDEALLAGMHARRLGGVLFIGLLLSLLGINLQFRLTFGWVFLLAASLILALSRVTRFLRSN